MAGQPSPNRPLAAGLGDEIVSAQNGLLAAVRAHGLPTGADADRIRKGYCAFFGMNGVIRGALEKTSPEFFAWLRCGEK